MNGLQIQALTKRYPGFSLEGVSFDIPAGTVVGLIGENGAGKSTVIKSILGAVRPDSGAILLNGKGIGTLSKKERQQIAFVLDDTGLPSELNLTELGQVLSRIFTTWNQERFCALQRQLQLPADKAVKDFSKGMRMKAAIAVSLSYDSRILILDEPTDGLDPVVRDEILGMIYDYTETAERAVLISSHITSDLEKLCDYIVYMHQGRVLIREEKDVLLRQYAVFSCEESVLSEWNRQHSARKIVRDYGVDILAYRSDIPAVFSFRQITLEDIMLFYSKVEVL